MKICCFNLIADLSLTIQPFIVSIRKLVLVTLDLIHASVGKLLDSVSEEVGSTPRRQ